MSEPTQHLSGFIALCQEAVDQLLLEALAALGHNWRPTMNRARHMPIDSCNGKPSVTLQFDDDVKIRLPDDVDLATPYILREQGAWFEKEVAFINAFVQSGMRIIDIGANYGVYTLPMAKRVGSAGSLISFEPASETHSYLLESLQENGFDHVDLRQCALSNAEGTAKLALHHSSELNQIVDDPSGEFEEVPVSTLDTCFRAEGWPTVDFVKLDAESHEKQIIDGGSEFFRTLSPLVMVEVLHQKQVNMELINCFAALGYSPYRYIQSIGCLVPFHEEESLDRYELNMFCCKTDMARRLEDRGLLVSQAALDEDRPLLAPGDWQSLYAGMPVYRIQFGDTPPEAILHARPDQGLYLVTLKLIALAFSSDQAPADRLNALRLAYGHLQQLTSVEEPMPSHLATFCRVCWALGERSQEIDLLNQSIQVYGAREDYRFDEPFLPVCPRYDCVDPGSGDAFFNWVLAQLIEQLEVRRTFSSYDSGASGLHNTEIVRKTGFADATLERRAALIRERFDLE